MLTTLHEPLTLRLRLRGGLHLRVYPDGEGRSRAAWVTRDGAVVRLARPPLC